MRRVSSFNSEVEQIIPIENYKNPCCDFCIRKYMVTCRLNFYIEFILLEDCHMTSQAKNSSIIKNKNKKQWPKYKIVLHPVSCIIGKHVKKC